MLEYFLIKLIQLMDKIKQNNKTKNLVSQKNNAILKQKWIESDRSRTYQMTDGHNL